MNKSLQREAVSKFIILIYRHLSEPYTKSFIKILSPLQYYTICVIQYFGEINMSSLSSEMKMPKQNMTKIINKLIELNFVQRIKSEKDKRMINIKLTTKGENFLLEDNKINSENITEEINKLGEKEVDKFYKAITTINDILGKLT